MANITNTAADTDTDDAANAASREIIGDAATAIHDAIRRENAANAHSAAVDWELQQALFSQLVDVLGRKEARTLMQQLPPIPWAQIATKDDLRQLSLDIQEKLVKLEKKFDKKLDTTNNRITGLETRITGLETRTTGLETRITGLETRMGRIEGQIVALAGKIVALEGKIDRGIAKMHRHMSWYLVFVASMIVGFGIAILIPLRDMAQQQSMANIETPAVTEPANTDAPATVITHS